MEVVVKRKMAVVAALTVVFAAQHGWAKTLEDVLKEKGVITEQDYQEVTKSKPVNYKVGEGFNFLSPDEKFKMNIGSCLQVRYTLLDSDDVNGSIPGKDYSKFELKRIKMYFNGHAYSKDLTYKLMINFANITGGTTNNGGLLEETWMNYRLLDEVQFRFGQDKVQFGRQFITSSAMQQFVDSSVVTTAFVPGYDTGLAINGKVAGGLFNYSIAGLGGLGQNTFRATTDNAFTARVVVNPLGDMKYAESDMDNSKKPLVSVGANYFHDTLNSAEQAAGSNLLNFNAAKKGWFAIGNPLSAAAKQLGTAATPEVIDYDTAGIDTAFKCHGFSAQAEYFFGKAHGRKSGNNLLAQGFYGQAGYFVIPRKLEVAARYSYIDPNRDVSNDHWVETTGAVSWYVNQHNLKVQADVTNVHKQKTLAAGANATDDMQVRLQAQIVF